MIEVENLSKRYGEKLAVDRLDFVVQPGVVTGFLGPNGAGKSTAAAYTAPTGLPGRVGRITAARCPACSPRQPTR
jgi:ABC-2 type transport system ATP-binding protein